METDKRLEAFKRLLDIMDDLRTGCPWDKEQTHSSLVPNFIEELYEAVEAIENKDFEHLSEELGDLLLHIIMQAQIAEEENFFTIANVLKKINQKLIRRHPHIFGRQKFADAKEVKNNWEKIKLEEKKMRKSVLEGIPKNLPALIKAQRIQEKAAAVGFDWHDVKPAIEKLDEEIKEFKEAFRTENPEEIKDELGDLFFSLVNISRKLGFDAESILNAASGKFAGRFRKIEEYHNHNHEKMRQTSLEKLDEIWRKVKNEKH
jgi:MazG family protein